MKIFKSIATLVASGASVMTVLACSSESSSSESKFSDSTGITGSESQTSLTIPTVNDSYFNITEPTANNPRYKGLKKNDDTGPSTSASEALARFNALNLSAATAQIHTSSGAKKVFSASASNSGDISVAASGTNRVHLHDKLTTDERLFVDAVILKTISLIANDITNYDATFSGNAGYLHGFIAIIADKVPNFNFKSQLNVDAVAAVFVELNKKTGTETDKFNLMKTNLDKIIQNLSSIYTPETLKTEVVKILARTQ